MEDGTIHPEDAARGHPLLRARQDFAAGETGQPCGAGLAAFGLDPAGLLVVRAFRRLCRDGLRLSAAG